MLLDRLHFNKETLRELMIIALPMVVSQGAFAVMIFTDRYFMSQIDPMHMAAALGGGVATFFSFCFFSGLFSYANAMAAQYLGAGELGKCSKVVTQGIIMTIMCSPLLVIITYFVADIFAGMGHDPVQVELERTYYIILMMGVVITLAKICISSYFAGIGRTYIVMICDVCGLLINIPLCYVMVFGKLGLPALGIVGAGISTIIATLFALLLFIIFYVRKEHREKFRVMESFRIDWGILRRFLRLGFPSGLELFLNVAAFNLFLLMFQGYGIVEGASAAIVFNWDMLSFVPIFFEFTVLCAAHGMAITYLIRNKTLPGMPPRNPDPRTTDDKFVMEIKTSENTHIKESVLSKLIKDTGFLEIEEKSIL